MMRHALRTCVALAAALSLATGLRAQPSPELSSLDLWIVQRYLGAQLMPDSNSRATVAFAQAGAPRVESNRSAARRDTVVALHFGAAIWRPTLGSSTEVQLADPTGAVSTVVGRVTARRAFRAPRVAGAREDVSDDWRFGWAYLVALPMKVANAAPSGFNGWAVVQDVSRSAPKAATKRARPSSTQPAAPKPATAPPTPIPSIQPPAPTPATQPPIH